MVECGYLRDTLSMALQYKLNCTNKCAVMIAHREELSMHIKGGMLGRKWFAIHTNMALNSN